MTTPRDQRVTQERFNNTVEHFANTGQFAMTTDRMPGPY
jgi:hypothetical protein